MTVPARVAKRKSSKCDVVAENERITSAAYLFCALGDETRLRIIDLLFDGEWCVCELCEALCISQPKISRHLAYLRDLELVQVRSDGKWKYYRLATSLNTLQERVLAAIEDWNKVNRNVPRPGCSEIACQRAARCSSER